MDKKLFRKDPLRWGGKRKGSSTKWKEGLGKIYLSFISELLANERDRASREMIRVAKG